MCTIHLDPILKDDPITDKYKANLLEVIAKIDSTISIHDFRVVVGNTHTNLIFDVVLPFDSTFTPKEITEVIKERVSKEMTGCFCVITVDRA